MDKMVDSASDARTANNAVRHQYRVLSDEEKALMVRMKDLALAKTKIEEAVMWAVKHVTA